MPTSEPWKTASVHGDVRGERGGVAAGRDVIAELINTGDHTSFFIGGYESLSDAYIDPWSVFERVEVDDFVGRHWLEAEVDDFLQQHSRGYFILEAQAGLGKSAFLAHLVKERGWIHHFVELAPGDAGIVPGRKNLAAQVMRAFELSEERAALPDEAAARPDFLSNLLRKAAERLETGEKVVIAVDGLDEAGTRSGENVLGLPRILPNNVFFVASKRPVPVTLRIEGPRRVFSLEAGSVRNLADVRVYLQRIASSGQIPSLRRNRQQGPQGGQQLEEFIESLVSKSRGVWVYLHYVLDEIKQGRTFDLEDLPDGLWRYYADFWKRWREDHQHDWYASHLQLLAILGAVQEDATLDLLCRLAGLEKSPEFESLFREQWRPFLAVQRDGNPRFRLYHKSLEDFLHGRTEESDLLEDEESFSNEIAEATVSAHKRIAEYYLSAWGGLEKRLPWLGDPVKRDLDGGYGLRHLARHLAESGWKEALYSLISKVWMEAHFASGSPDSFAQDVEAAIRVASSEAPPNYRQEIRASLIYGALGSTATKASPEVLGALAQLGQLGRAIGYATLIQDNERKSAAYRSIAQVTYSTAADKGQELLRNALDAALAVQWLPSKVDALVKLGRVALKLNETELATCAANRVVEAAQLDWIDTRKAHALNQAARIYNTAGKGDKAVAIAENAFALIERPSEDKEESGTVQFAIAVTLDQAGNPDRAQEVADSATDLLSKESDSYDTSNTVELLKEVAGTGAVESALAFVGELWGWYEPLGLLEVAKAVLEAGDRVQAADKLEAALAAADGLLADGGSEYAWMEEEKNGCLLDLTGVCSELGRFDDALTVAGKIQDPDTRASALGMVAQQLATAKPPDRSQATRLVEEAMSLMRASKTGEERKERSRRRSTTLKWIIETCARGGRFEEAQEFVTMLPEKADRVSALCSIIADMAQKRRESAVVAARLATTLADEIKPADYGERAMMTKDSWARTEAEAAAERDRGKALLAAARALLLVGQADEVHAISNKLYSAIEGMRDPNVKRNLLDDAVQILTEAGRITSIEQLRKIVGDLGGDLYELYMSAAIGAAKKGNMDYALALINEAPRNTVRPDGDNEQIDAWRAYVKVCALSAASASAYSSGRRPEAITLAEEAVSTASPIEEPWERAMALGTAARAMASIGLNERARIVAREALLIADALCSAKSGWWK